MLEHLWLGLINPSERNLPPGIENYFNEFSLAKRDLLETLSPEQQTMLRTTLDLYHSMHREIEKDAFMNGFRTATQLMIESTYKLPK